MHNNNTLLPSSSMNSGHVSSPNKFCDAAFPQGNAILKDGKKMITTLDEIRKGTVTDSPGVFKMDPKRDDNKGLNHISVNDNVSSDASIEPTQDNISYECSSVKRFQSDIDNVCKRKPVHNLAFNEEEQATEADAEVDEMKVIHSAPEIIKSMHEQEMQNTASNGCGGEQPTMSFDEYRETMHRQK